MLRKNGLPLFPILDVSSSSKLEMFLVENFEKPLQTSYLFTPFPVRASNYTCTDAFHHEPGGSCAGNRTGLHSKMSGGQYFKQKNLIKRVTDTKKCPTTKYHTLHSAIASPNSNHKTSQRKQTHSPPSRSVSLSSFSVFLSQFFVYFKSVLIFRN